MENMKSAVRDFWNEASCGEELYLDSFTKDSYERQAKIRYELEPQISFGEFEKFAGKRTLEVGVGLGADHQKLAEAGASLFGVDLTARAIGHTKRRFELFGLKSALQMADAENLPFADSTFDAVYSWGVIHHSPNTQKAVDEIFRVLKPGGFVKVMIYHKYSMVGYMLWARYALFAMKPWRSLEYVYHHHLESPGTKAYSRAAAQRLFRGFEVQSIETPLGHGDLLTSEVGQRHRGNVLKIAMKIWPRAVIKKVLPNHGLGMMLTLRKAG
jgi:ubiquinone/menaquinone biosynthesis C-methylase UbiE